VINVNNSVLFDGGSAGALSTSANVQVADKGQLQASGMIGNSGTIGLNSTGDSTSLAFFGPVTLQGGGLVTLSDNVNNSIVAGFNGTTLTNVDNTISGAGVIGQNADGQLTLSNAGTIDATGTQPLAINTGKEVTNSGTLEATGGGLVIKDAVSNSGTIASLGASGMVTIDNSITNTATATVSAAVSGALVNLVGGSINGGDFGGDKANIAKGATLQATGGPSASSTLFNLTVADQGTLLASKGTTLSLADTTVNAAGGVLKAVDAGSTILLNFATINGGTLTTAGGGAIETVAGSNDTLNGSAISADVNLTVVDNSTLTVMSKLTVMGSVSNAGTLALTGNAADIVATAAGAKLTSTGTISGAGQVGTGNQDLTLNNSGTIDANATGSVALVIDTGNLMVNTGTLEADAGGGGLTIDDGVTNTAAAATNGLFADGANVNVVGAVTGGGAATIAGERNGCLHRRDQRHAEARPRPKLRRDCRRIGEHRPDRPRQFPVLGQSDDQQGHRHRRGEYHHQRYGDGRGVERHAGPVEPARQRVRGERFGLHAQV
jgi:hypothetical protein